MKIEIRCPSCNKGYLVEEGSLGGPMQCPNCSTSMVARVEPARESAAVAVAAVATASDVPGGNVGTRTIAPPAPDPAQAASPEEIVCPRCQLHFAPRRQSARPAEGRRPRVLIVEDNAFFQEVAADALSDEYELIPVDSASSARNHLALGTVDLMVLDLTLDGPESGLELMRGLAAKPCPILIFTARDESEMYGESWDELRELGADDMVLKGMNAGESLLRKVGTLLGKRWDDED